MPEVNELTIKAVATHLNKELQSLGEDTEGTNKIITETKKAAKQLLEAVKENSDQLREKRNNFKLRTVHWAKDFLQKLMDRNYTFSDLYGDRNRDSYWLNVAVTMAVQTLLVEQDYLSGDENIDGLLTRSDRKTSKTKDAIRKFQQDKHLKVDWVPWPKTIKELLNGTTSEAEQQTQEQKENADKLRDLQDRTLTELLTVYPTSIWDSIGDIATKAWENIPDKLQTKIDIINIIQDSQYNSDIDSDHMYSHNEINELRKKSNTANDLVKKYQKNNESLTDDNYQTFINILNQRINSANTYKANRKNEINEVSKNSTFTTYIKNLKEALKNIDTNNKWKPMDSKKPHFKKFEGPIPTSANIREWIKNFIDWNKSNLQLLDWNNKTITKPSLPNNCQQIFSEDSDQMKEIFNELYTNEWKFDENKIMYGDGWANIQDIDKIIQTNEQQQTQQEQQQTQQEDSETQNSDLQTSNNWTTLDTYQWTLDTAIIPSEIKEIGSEAFKNNNTIKEITIENTNTITLKDQAFSNCQNLTKITFKSKVINLEKGATTFIYNCNKQLKLIFPNDVIFKSGDTTIDKKDLRDYFGDVPITYEN